MKNDRSYLPVGSKRSTSLSPNEYALITLPLLCGPGALLKLGSWVTSTRPVGRFECSPCEIATVELEHKMKNKSHSVIPKSSKKENEAREY